MTMRERIGHFLQALAAQPLPHQLAIGMAGALGIAIVDLLTGPEIAFSIFYLLPVALITWTAGRSAGFAIAATCAILWLIADYLAGASYSHPLIPLWNACVRLGMFTAIAAALAALRRGYRESEERARLLLAGVREYAIVFLDPNGKITTWNSGAERLLGYKETEIVGTSFSAFFPPDAAERPMRLLKRAATEGRAEDEGWRVRKDGTRFWAGGVIAPIRDPAGVLIGFSKVVRDMSELRLREQALRDSEERARLLLDNIADTALFLVDAQGRIESWNRGAELILGYRSDEILGLPLARLYPDELNARAAADRDLREASGFSGRVESTSNRIGRDGGRILLHFAISRVLDATGQPRGYCITARKAASDTERIASGRLAAAGQPAS
jgi:PAS domain S-box-containing protein